LSDSSSILGDWP